MSVQMSTTLRNALLDQLATTFGASPHIEIWSGSMPANCAAASSGTKLAKFSLAATFSDAAASGVKNICKTTSLPVSTTGLAAGTAGYYRIFANDDSTCHEQGTMSASGGGGDLTIDNTTIAVGQTVQITGFTKTAAGA